MNKIARLTPKGMMEFAQWLSDQPKNFTSSPAQILSSRENFIELDAELPDQRSEFQTRLSAGKFLFDVLRDVGEAGAEDPGLWSWLTIALWDQMGFRKNVRSSHFILEKNYRSSYRHVLWNMYQSYFLHARDVEKAAIILIGPVGHGEIVEQLTSRFSTWSSPGALEMAGRLYIDAKSQKILTGAAGKQPGAVRDYGHWLKRIAFSVDVQTVSADELEALLVSPLKELALRNRKAG